MIERMRDAVSLLWREIAKFGIIGVVNFAIDIGLFNVLVDGPLAKKVTTAKFVSGGIATIFAWLGNRYWTFRHRRNRPVAHEVVLFFLVNGIALLITTGWVAFAHYVLGAQGKVALNVHAFIGIGLGTLFRFWTYHKYVFAKEPEVGVPEEQADTDPTERSVGIGQ